MSNNIMKQLLEHSQKVLNKLLKKNTQPYPETSTATDANTNAEYVLVNGLTGGKKYYQLVGIFEGKNEGGFLTFNDQGLISSYAENSSDIDFIQDIQATYVPQSSGETRDNEYLGGDPANENVMRTILRHSQNIIGKIMQPKIPTPTNDSVEPNPDVETLNNASNNSIFHDVLFNSQKVLGKLLKKTPTSATGRFQQGSSYKYYVGKFVEIENNHLKFVRDDFTPLELVVPANTRFQEISEYGDIPQAVLVKDNLLEPTSKEPDSQEAVALNEDSKPLPDIQLPPVVSPLSSEAPETPEIDQEDRDEHNYFDRPIPNVKQITIKSIDDGGVKQNKAYTVTLNSDKSYRMGF